jgi:hypothetical protein
MRFTIFMIKECIHNHPLKKFANEDCELVGILIEARGTKHDVQNFYSQEIYHEGSTLNLDHYREQRFDGQRDKALVRAG